MITKIMPHQKDAEQRILGILFMDISKIQSCMDLIDEKDFYLEEHQRICLLYTSPSPRDRTRSRMPSSAWKSNYRGKRIFDFRKQW